MSRIGGVHIRNVSAVYTGISSGDYHLKSTSPAIGTGSMTNAPTTDLDGVLRGTPMVIGSYKH